MSEVNLSPTGSGSPVTDYALVNVDNITIVGDGADTPLRAVGGSIEVITDGTSIGGDGTHENPVHLLAVTDDGTTIAGAGVTGSPLHVVPAGLADKVAVLTDGTTIVGTGQTGSPLTVITGGGGGAIVADNVTLTGFGTVSVPVALLAVQHDDTLTGAGSVSSHLAVAPSALADKVAVAADGTSIAGTGVTGDPLHIIGIPNVTRVSYTATGSEGTDFNVPIGATLSNTNYSVICTPAGVAFIPGIDCPTTGRTTTLFPVSMTAQPTAGDVFNFLLVQ